MNSNIYSPQLYKEINANNKKLLEYYIRSLKKNKRENTVTQYQSDLRMFLCWNYLYNDDMDVTSFKKRHFEDYQYFLIDTRNVSNARVNRIFAPIHMMMDYAEDDDDLFEHYTRNVSKKIRTMPKDPVREIVFLSDDDILNLRNTLIEEKEYKLLAIMDVFYDSGARINEIAQMKRVNTLMNGYSNLVEHKGGAKHPIVLHERAMESIGLYLQQPNKHNLDDLWLTYRTYTTASEDAIREWVSAIGNRINIKLNPHAFRHSFVENLGNGTHYLCGKIGRALTVDEIAQLVHHKSSDTTKIYMKPKDNQILFDLFGIKIE